MSIEVPSTDTIVMTSIIELESLFGPSFDEYFNGENQVVSKPSAVTTADASDKRQQQPDSTSSTSTLATTVTADGNFDVNKVSYAIILEILPVHPSDTYRFKHKFWDNTIASNDLWIWHAFFGVFGMNNDVNVLRQSPILNDLKSGRAPDVPFVANNVPYKRGYYLTDGIYPQWSVLIKSIKNPGTNDHKRILYKTKHEAARKDVERAFGVLKQKWKLIKYPAQGMSQSRLSDVMYTCIILHNVIIHDNGNAISPDYFPEEQHRDDDPVRTHEESMQVTQEIISRTGHLSLKADLVEHIWNNAN
ncbi:ALP1-like protein [Tanacetum coccineum]|uniref:ALP1-like protein n=1 Tax=Tanacetum coccineum TaxID=301880 RepID=A0ABQ5CJH2_9ASTR